MGAAAVEVHLLPVLSSSCSSLHLIFIAYVGKMLKYLLLLCCVVIVLKCVLLVDPLYLKEALSLIFLTDILNQPISVAVRPVSHKVDWIKTELFEGVHCVSLMFYDTF